ncbi:MAG TPA: hypothetical protein VHW67_06205 [Solirubrobacteraceae bacterium]|nr:hypothetical protein [Solirubrobacteraceae bacterium]
MRPPDSPPAHRRLETWLWTGPLGHLLGGGLDVAQGLLLYLRTQRAGGGRGSRRDPRPPQ